jgi:hypothetical protein
MTDQKSIELFCDNGHTKWMPEHEYREKYSHGTVLMCRRCDDKVHMVTLEEHVYPEAVLAKAAEVEAKDKAQGEWFRKQYGPKAQR